MVDFSEIVTVTISGFTDSADNYCPQDCSVLQSLRFEGSDSKILRGVTTKRPGNLESAIPIPGVDSWIPSYLLLLKALRATSMRLFFLLPPSDKTYYLKRSHDQHYTLAFCYRRVGCW